MARSDQFANGTGIDVHARTKIVDDWSLISGVAVRVGDDIFEVVNDNTYYWNGIANVEMPLQIAGGKYTITHQIEHLDATNESGEVFQDTMEAFTIDFGATEHGAEQIKIQNYKSMIAIRVEAALRDTGGMIGVQGKKGMIARDMESHIIDPNEMGFEWQVRDTDPQLFQDSTHNPQYPERCILPSSTDSRRRKLRISEVEMNEARTACRSADEEMFEFCVHDVLMARNTDVAKPYHYGFAF